MRLSHLAGFHDSILWPRHCLQLSLTGLRQKHMRPSLGITKSPKTIELDMECEQESNFEGSACTKLNNRQILDRWSGTKLWWGRIAMQCKSSAGQVTVSMPLGRSTLQKVEKVSWLPESAPTSPGGRIAEGEDAESGVNMLSFTWWLPAQPPPRARHS